MGLFEHSQRKFLTICRALTGHETKAPIHRWDSCESRTALVVQGATAQHEDCKVIHPQQQPATPGHQPRELRSSILRRLHWRSVQSAGNLQSIILLIKLSVNKKKMPGAPGRACCQLIANCCVTEWDWDVNTSLRCIPYSNAGSVSCSNSGKLHFIMFVYSNIHFTNCHICLYYIRTAQGRNITHNHSTKC